MVLLGSDADEVSAPFVPYRSDLKEKKIKKADLMVNKVNSDLKEADKKVRTDPKVRILCPLLQIYTPPN